MIRVLIVDDNDNNRLTLNLLLEEVEDVEVHEAEDGQIAVEMCVKQNYDLIFMDIMMPNMDGFEATKYIKQMHKNSMIMRKRPNIKCSLWVQKIILPNP